MRLISLWQPWGSFMAKGFKRYETRSWKTDYRGVLGVHASKRWQGDQKRILGQLILKFPELRDFAVYDWSFGCVLSAHRLIAIHRTEDIRGKLPPLESALGDYSDGRYAWEMPLIKLPPAPIPTVGRQGIWNWDYPPNQEKE
jgi:hypothetical protein